LERRFWQAREEIVLPYWENCLVKGVWVAQDRAIGVHLATAVSGFSAYSVLAIPVDAADS